MQLAKKQITTFQKMILSWYVKNKRDLPWREVPVGTSLSQRVYYVLVSEVMSQQTQINRVIPKYELWMKKFPTVEDLAAANVANVLRYWSGLGYNRRALNLKKTAEIVVRKYHGKFPENEKALLELPGIGEYTARAILCFAFNQQVAVVDTNVRKVIITQVLKRHREEKSDEAISKKIASLPLAMTTKEIAVIAEQLLPTGRAYDWNQALMDYASSELKKEKIVLPKQSKFVGSHRYYRGQILKMLLEKNEISVVQIGKIIKKDFKENENDWLQKLLQELSDEGFIVIQQGKVRLA